MRSPLSHLITAVILLAGRSVIADPTFGLDDHDGSASVREANESEIKRLRGKAAVQGRIIFPSPDGRYGFTQPSEAEAEQAGEKMIPNHLVDLKSLKSVLKVQDMGDVEMAEGPGMRVRWRADSKAALFTAPGPCMGSAYLLVAIGKDGKAVLHDLGGLVWDAARKHLENEWPAIRQELGLPADALWDGELLTMAFDFTKNGTAVNDNGDKVMFQATFRTNPTESDGAAEVTLHLVGVMPVATGQLKVARQWISEAGITAHDAAGEAVLKNRRSLRQMKAEVAQKGLLFGMDDSTGMIGVYEIEETESDPLAQKRADVPGRLVFPSPDGRYAFTRPTIQDAEAKGYEVSNHLVDLKTMKQIAVVMDGEGDFERRNHGGMRVKWRAESRAAIFFADAKWAPAGFLAILIDSEGKVRSHDITTHAEAAIRAELKRRWPEIRAKLKLPEEEEQFDGTNGPWSFEYLRCGADFTADGAKLRVKSILQTNGKQMEGQVSATVETEGTLDLASGTFTPAATRVVEAGVAHIDDEGRDFLKPRITFPPAARKK